MTSCRSQPLTVHYRHSGHCKVHIFSFCKIHSIPPMTTYRLPETQRLQSQLVSLFQTKSLRQKLSASVMCGYQARLYRIIVAIASILNNFSSYARNGNRFIESILGSNSVRMNHLGSLLFFRVMFIFHGLDGNVHSSCYCCGCHVWPSDSVSSRAIMISGISRGSQTAQTPPPLASTRPTSLPTKLRPTFPGPIPIHRLTPLS